MIATTRRLLILICSLGLIVSPVAANVNLPDFGEPADQTLSPAEEAEIGARIEAQLHAAGLILEDQELTEYITSVGAKLAAHGGSSPNGFKFFVIRDDSINAFALPGGYIGIHTGLLKASTSESELAGVVAHEEAHVTQRHIARQLQGSTGWTLATAALVVAAALAGATDPDLIQAALGVGLASIQQRQINHTRAHELEADRLGIRTLADAGYDPKGMATFFERLHQQTRLYGNQLPEILLTHPVSATRVSEALNRADDYEPVNRSSSDQYKYMRARARILASAPPTLEREFFQRSLDHDESDDEARYGLAVIDILSGDGSGALEHLQAIDDTDQVNVQLAMAQAEHTAGQNEAALARYAALLRRHPNYQPIALAYADTLVRTGESDEARRVLLDSIAYRRHEPDAYRLLALAARDSGREPEAHYQMAAFFKYRGNYRAAINQLHTGLQRPNLSDSERARLESRMLEYRRTAPEELRRTGSTG
ncbi:MAG: M48 family metallopeptidase [Abyssibacter sp.]|nr:M48 family metalloprotease [Abyssibacter sp.]MCK5858005.1 M48 family metallopeptidase [Abyssibacter sp.]